VITILSPPSIVTLLPFSSDPIDDEKFSNHAALPKGEYLLRKILLPVKPVITMLFRLSMAMLLPRSAPPPPKLCDQYGDPVVENLARKMSVPPRPGKLTPAMSPAPVV
jgi:hypothetical protein